MIDEDKFKPVVQAMIEAKFTYKQTMALTNYMKFFMDEYMKATKE